MGVQKTTKNKPLKSRQLYQNGLKLKPPGAAKVRPNCDPFRNFLHPGPEMGQESSRGPKGVAQDVQKVPKGFQKVAKSHEKDIQKPSTRHTNAISKCIGNSIGNSISNAIAKAIATAIGNRSPRHGGGKAEGNWIKIGSILGTSQMVLKTLEI